MNSLRIAVLLAALLAVAPAAAQATARSPLIPFRYLQGHFLVVPVRIDDRFDTEFILDTGIGINVISARLAKQLGCRTQGEHVGQRMSGQEVHCAMTRVASLAIGARRLADVPCGVMDFEANHFGVDPSVTGFVGLSFFRDRAFTLDYRSRRIYLESEASLARRRARGTPVPIRIHEMGPETTIFARLRVAGRHDAEVEIDTGSPSLTLAMRYMPLLDLSPTGSRVRKVTGSDETAFTFVRHFAKSPIQAAFAATPGDPGAAVRTMFQLIIYDGLIGHSLLRHYVVTYDLPHRAMILAR